ncbi:GNAT family N-acetyltransferase [Sphingomicrobium sp. XHP0239]|uniref:GNAT family N-acetyltransferase n=1 Tax=Sphingomicrobium maritimum TaxID=3133972 RepID=UPI0031CCC822
MRRAVSPGLTGERAEELRTDRLVLRRARSDDAAALHELFTDEETMRCWSRPVHDTMFETEEWLRSMIEVDEAHSDDFIVEKDGELIGKCGLWSVPEIGFMIRRDHWGEGLASEALGTFVDYIAGRGLPYLFADVDPDNPGSIRVLEKAGFERSGFEEGSSQVGGRPVDSIYMRRDL